MIRDGFKPEISSQYGKEWTQLVNDMLDYDVTKRPEPVEVIKRL